MEHVKQSAAIFIEFLKRDCAIYAKRFKTNFINYGLIQPSLYVFCFGVLYPRILAQNTDPVFATFLVSSTLFLQVLNVAYMITYELVFDFENERFINYQITLLNPRLVLLERILFYSIFTFVMVAPFFPVAKILLATQFATQQTSWFKLFAMLYMGCLCVASYHVFAACYITNAQSMIRFWVRVNHLLFTFGGFLVPWYLIYKNIPLLGMAMLLNPLMYCNEGIRAALVPTAQLLPWSLCFGAVSTFTLLFIILALYAFKQKVDHL